MNELDALRLQLDALDEQLVRTAAERLDVARRIGEYKARSGTATYDRARELVVMERVRERSRRHGLSPDLGTALVGALMEAGHAMQEAVQPGLHATEVLIVGAKGAMGQWFAEHFTARGLTVTGVDRDDADDLPAAVRAADVVLVAVSMNAARTVIEQLIPHLRSDALLCDINSLKAGVCDAYQKAPCEALGLHPMFGPTTASMRRQKVVACPVKSGPRSEAMLNLLASMGADIVYADPEEHDHMMALVQVVTHFRTIATGVALSRSGTAVQDSLRFTSPIYRLELSVIGRLFSQDPELYASILFDNPRGPAIRTLLHQANTDLDALVSNQDRSGFIDLFTRTAAWFDGFAEVAQDQSDRIIEHLVREP